MPVSQPILHRVPVHLRSGEAPQGQPRPGIGLCLSGGGYRATLFHVGALWRMNEAGLLPRLSRVSSVSGGSITAGTLGLYWRNLAFDESGLATRFETEVVERLRRLASTTIDLWSVVKSGFGLFDVGKRVAGYYDKFLFDGATLQDLCDDPPNFLLNATNVQSGVLWRFSKAAMSDYRVGTVRDPSFPLALAVAASSAFPPVLSPVTFRLKETDFAPPEPLNDLHRPPFTTRIVLVDGAVYDNLGLETVWKNYDTVLVSDAGSCTPPLAQPSHFWIPQARRVIELMDNQVLSLRKRQLIESYETTESHHREGTYWGVASDMKKYQVEGQLDCPEERTAQLAQLPTRLKALPDVVQERLINWGYAICDAALRKHCTQVFAERYGCKLQPPRGFPYPQAAV